MPSKREPQESLQRNVRLEKRTKRKGLNIILPKLTDFVSLRITTLFIHIFIGIFIVRITFLFVSFIIIACFIIILNILLYNKVVEQKNPVKINGLSFLCKLSFQSIKMIQISNRRITSESHDSHDSDITKYIQRGPQLNIFLILGISLPS